MFQPKFLLHFSELGLQTRFFANEKFIFAWTGLTGQKGTPRTGGPLGPKNIHADQSIPFICQLKFPKV